MELLIRKCPYIPGFAFPDKRSFVSSPAGDVPVQTVVRNIQLATTKPLRMRCVPLQNRVPLLEPVKLLGHACPESLRVSARFGTQLLQFGHRFDMGPLGKSWRWLKDSIFPLK